MEQQTIRHVQSRKEIICVITRFHTPEKFTLGDDMFLWITYIQTREIGDSLLFASRRDMFYCASRRDMC